MIWAIVIIVIVLLIKRRRKKKAAKKQAAMRNAAMPTGQMNVAAQNPEAPVAPAVQGTEDTSAQQ